MDEKDVGNCFKSESAKPLTSKEITVSKGNQQIPLSGLE